MEIDLASFALSFAFSVIGWSAFRYGRKRSDMRKVAIGLILMIYGYFLDGPLLVGLVGALLTVLLFWP